MKKSIRTNKGNELLNHLKLRENDKALQIINSRATVPHETDSIGLAALHIAAINDDVEMFKALFDKGARKDVVTKIKQTPLHLAVQKGHVQMVQLLLQLNFDTNAKDMFKMTPLHWAVQEDHPNIVEQLLKHGADPNAKSAYAESPRDIAEEMCFDDIIGMFNKVGRSAAIPCCEAVDDTMAGPSPKLLKITNKNVPGPNSEAWNGQHQPSFDINTQVVRPTATITSMDMYNTFALPSAPIVRKRSMPQLIRMNPPAAPLPVVQVSPQVRVPVPVPVPGPAMVSPSNDNMVQMNISDYERLCKQINDMQSKIIAIEKNIITTQSKQTQEN